MVTFEVTSAQEVTVNGIGLLRAGETVALTDLQVANFEAHHGQKIGEANFPPYVKLVAVTFEDESAEEV